MFFKPKVSLSVWPILEVGPGSLPFYLSDVWLDFLFNKEDIRKQSGNQIPATGKPKVYYTGGRFPFKDKTFQYVIASHVLEHVPWDDIPLFISELERVAFAGYIEIPRWTWEILGDFDVHISSGDIINDVLYLFKKLKRFDNSEIFQEFLYLKSCQEFIRLERDLFFCHIEWENSIRYKLCELDHPFDKDKISIKKQLADDIQKYHSGNTLEYSIKKQEQKRIKLFLRNLPRLLRRKRKLLSLDELRMYLQCPFTGSDINENWMNFDNTFGYSVNENNLIPNARSSLII